MTTLTRVVSSQDESFTRHCTTL